MENIEILKTTWPTSWFNVKTELENMKQSFISYDEYKEICSSHNISEKSKQDILLDFLNDLGVVIHFKDFKLLDTHVLEPKWVTQAVYKIINSKELADNKGILKFSLLDKILDKKIENDYHYPSKKYKYIIDLMMKFELCYDIDSQKVLIPDLLDIQEPSFDFDFENALTFIIKYDFFPKSVMPRFIVKMHKDIKDELCWRTGVVLENKDFISKAVIKSDEKEKKIYINVSGEQKRDYFSVIRHAFLSINSSFEKLTAIEKVLMPDEPDITVSYNHLINLEKRGIKEYIPDGSEKEYVVKELLGTIYVEKNTEEEIVQFLKKIMDQNDNPQSMLRKATDYLLLQPNIFGLGIDLNKLIKKHFK